MYSLSCFYIQFLLSLMLISHNCTQINSHLLTVIVHSLTCQTLFSRSIITYKILHTIGSINYILKSYSGEIHVFPASAMSPGGNHGTARQRTTIPGPVQVSTLNVTPTNPIHTIQHHSYIISIAHIV